MKYIVEASMGETEHSELLPDVAVEYGEAPVLAAVDDFVTVIGREHSLTGYVMDRTFAYWEDGFRVNYTLLAHPEAE